MKEVKMQTGILVALMSKGNIKELHPALTSWVEWAAMTKAAQEASAKEPKRSEPIPATSPTLSPTLSAMVAGLYGESSSISSCQDLPVWGSVRVIPTTLPERSAPTSAALVKIPPPTRPKRAIEEPPRP